MQESINDHPFVLKPGVSPVIESSNAREALRLDGNDAGESPLGLPRGPIGIKAGGLDDRAGMQAALLAGGRAVPRSALPSSLLVDRRRPEAESSRRVTNATIKRPS